MANPSPLSLLIPLIFWDAQPVKLKLGLLVHTGTACWADHTAARGFHDVWLCYGLFETCDFNWGRTGNMMITGFCGTLFSDQPMLQWKLPPDLKAAASIATIVVSILMGAIYAMWGEYLFPAGLGNPLRMARLGCASTGLCTFWIFLCFWQRMRRIFAGPKMTFLDTICIAQHDEAKKKQGILGLSTFLDHSEHLTILWSRNFFSRLWCTYEVSTFLRHKHEKQVQVMPVTLAWLFLVMIILIQASICGNNAADMHVRANNMLQ